MHRPLRPAEAADVPSIVALQANCESAEQRLEESEISRRLRSFVPGAILATGASSEDCRACLISQRIARVCELAGSDSRRVSTVHQDDGPFWLVLNVLVRACEPAEELRLREALLRQVLLLAMHEQGVRALLVVTREQYGIDGRSPPSPLDDPSVRFHLDRGAAFEQCLPASWWPSDTRFTGTRHARASRLSHCQRSQCKARSSD